MRYEFKFEPAFKADCKREMRLHPSLKPEFESALRELAESGTVSEEYSPHRLDRPGGNYSGHIDFHLSDGETDVTVLFLPHKTNPVIRFVRMGPHRLLFQGPEK